MQPLAKAKKLAPAIGRLLTRQLRDLSARFSKTTAAWKTERPQNEPNFASEELFTSKRLRKAKRRLSPTA